MDKIALKSKAKEMKDKAVGGWRRNWKEILFWGGFDRSCCVGTIIE